MGFFDIITSIFSKSDKTKPAKAKKAAGKSAPPKKGPAQKTAKKKPKEEKASGGLLFNLNKKNGKKRKKSEQISADPIDEKALGFSISLKGEDEQSKKRNALRIKVDNLVVFIPRLKKQFPVTDISATGLGFAFEKPRIKGGVKIEMDIFLNGKAKASGVVCKTMRHERGSVGCIFVDLDRAQDDAVHEIVLLGQKQQAARKAAQKDRNFNLPE